MEKNMRCIKIKYTLFCTKKEPLRVPFFALYLRRCNVIAQAHDIAARQ
jgi:hypothetical protein